MKIQNIEKWQNEILLAEKFREDEFGCYEKDKKSKAGFNINYFEKGYADTFSTSTSEIIPDWTLTTANLFHAICKVVIPSIIFQNPRVLAFPKKIDSQDTAPIVSEILNHFYKKTDAEEINQKIVWDAYMLGYGISKIGYATKYGVDVESDEKKRSVKDRILESIGLKKPVEKEETRPEMDYRIVSENPYISYVSPFNFGIDPRATSLENAMYVYEKFKKTLKQMKANKKYKNTDKLIGTNPDLPSKSSASNQNDIDDFKTIDLYEVHYRTEDGPYILVLSKDGEEWREHYNEKSIYEIDGWQYEMLTFNQHGHKLYPISDMTKIRVLQERLNNTIDSILEQVDRFVPKIAANETELTPAGKRALTDGDIGAVVWTTKNPTEVFKELMFTQLKADLKVLVDEIINIVSIQTGITKAQLTGLSQSSTATEATIEQGGQTLRLSDMSRAVNRFLKRQATKLWVVIRQFVELEELQMINGVAGMDEQTGLPKYNWLTVDYQKGDRMRNGEYDFDIEVGSTQKPDLAVIRKQFENMFSILARTDVIALMQQQGKKVDLAELLRMYLQLFPEMLKDIGRIIQPITQNTKGLVDLQQISGRGGNTSGSNFNAMERQMGEQVPSMPSELGGG